MTLQILQVIIAACQVGSIGMGGQYSMEGTILEHQKIMLQRSMDMQRSCQKRLVACVKGKTGFIRTVAYANDVADCLTEQP